MTDRLALGAALRHIYEAGALGASPWPRVEAIPGHHLPIWDCVIAERRLDGSPRVDVMGAICDRRRGGLAPELEADPIFPAPTLPLLTRWRRADRDDPLRGAPLLWFEWDMHDNRPQPPLGSICLSNAIVGAHAARQAPETGPERRRLLAHACAAMLAGADAPSWQDPLERLLQALGDDGELLHVAGLAPRGITALRLTLFVRVGALPRWLREIAWPGRIDDLQPLLDHLQSLSSRVCAQIELYPAVGAYLAIETQELRSLRAAAHARPGHRGLAELASASTLALDDLSSWPGEGTLRADPRELQVLRHFYTKLVHQPGPRWSAKAYVGLTARSMTQPPPRTA